MSKEHGDWKSVAQCLTAVGRMGKKTFVDVNIRIDDRCFQLNWLVYLLGKHV